MSAPLCCMTCCGAMTLPSDFDILRPFSSSTKPCAMLGRAFEIEIGGPSELRPLLQHKGVGRARIEPYLDDIGDFLPFGGGIGIAAEIHCVGGEPDIRPRLLDGGGDALDD